MAPAIQTSKRKFYKLLDGLNTSQTNVSKQTTKNGASTTTVNEEPIPKRSRVSIESRLSGTTLPDSVRAVGSTSLAPSKSSARPKTSDSKTQPRPSPNYQPYSQPAFLERLKTFSDVKVWTYKPSEISELQWAKRGWVCEGNKVDVVACKGGCEARVVVRLARGRERAKAFGETDGADGTTADTNDGLKALESSEGDTDWLDGADEALVAKYQELIVNGHHEDCLWKMNGCKDDIYRIRMADAATWQTELVERYLSLVKIESALPERFRSPQASTTENQSQSYFDVDKIQSTLSGILTAPPTTATTDSRPATEDSDTQSQSANSTSSLNSTAATLTLFGWQGSSPHNIHLATCSRCFQRVGLWLYSSNPTTKAVPASESGIADDNIMRFDLVGLHREHCPWINADTQAGLGQFAGLPAWEILVRLIKARRAIQDGVRAQEAMSNEDFSTNSPESLKRPREEVEAEDRARDSKLAKLKRAFTIKKENRKSWKSTKSTG